ncbi:MAG TPA: EscU/YscU/HrcU family type III secretion system export apparatus switch protein [Spirochaetota bacterium]|nr:EscU/YscU/HrcU family type III secretion system export apparatus switch protein [Spirochaetota bacterium]HPP03763.1 EscU/YscU/HrcU family type III secretion system export apparatus switch protein [Spirochaetota bacterium]
MFDEFLSSYFEILENIEFDFDLQRFASAEDEGRTEKATEHKKKKAREEEGKVPLSKELPSSLITLFCFLVLYFLGSYYFKILYDTTKYTISNIFTFNLTDQKIYYDLLLIPLAKIFLPIGITAFIVAILSNYLQIGFKFTPKVIKPNLKKISPNIFKFFKNQVFSINGAFSLFKSLIKVVIIAIITAITIIGKIEEIKNTIFMESVLNSTLFLASLSFDLVIRASLVLVVFSILDILYTRWKYEEELKMKKQEVKEEYKEMYGDPHVKQRLRQMYNNLLSQKKMLEEVPKADVVVTNPTHYAVALRYNPSLENAPRVVAKGKDKFAQKIKEVARENDIYMYENVMLARTLYNEVELNEIIPVEMYGLVITAYKFAIQYKESRKVFS